MESSTWLEFNRIWMNKRYPIILIIFILFTPWMLGQELSTINYGIRSDIKTNTIYDIHFSSDSLLYIATDKGLWQYNGVQFKEIPMVTGGSVDGSYLRERPSGEIYMQDFNGQLYQVIDDSLRLEPRPEDIKTKIIAIHLGAQHIYYINGQKIFVYDYRGQQQRIITYLEKDRIFNDFVTANGVLGVTLIKENKTIRKVSAQLKNGALKVFDEPWSVNFEHQFQDQRLIKDQAQKQLYTPDRSLLVDWSNCPQELTPRLVHKLSNTILVGCAEGLYLPSTNRLTLLGKNITDLVEDHEGNIWIATLNKGLHKLSSLKNNYYPIDSEEKVVHLIHKKEGQLIYADRESNLYQYNGKAFECFFKSPVKGYPKNLYFDEKEGIYVFSGGYLQTFDRGLEALIYQGVYGELRKDREGYVFGKYRVGARVFYGKLKDFHDIQRHSKTNEQLQYQGSLYKSISYDNKVEVIHFDQKVKSEETFKWKDQLIYYFKDSLYFDNLSDFYTTTQIPIYGRFEKLTIIAGQLYVQTQDSLLAFNLKAEQLNAIPRTNGLEKSIKFWSGDGKYLSVTTFDAVYVFDASNFQLLNRFTPQNGIVSIDFNKAWVFEDKLYVNGSEGGTEIALEQPNDRGKPSLSFESIVIDGEKMRSRQFSYQQNSLSINFRLRSFTAKGKLYWRLNAKNWRTQETSSQIRLDDLQYGSYRLEAYWLNDLGARSAVLELDFVIHRPYWLQLWFMLMVISLSLAFAYIFYRRRMHQLKMKSQLENNLITSQMTALKSQMSPHFIFNALNSIQSLIVYEQTEEAYDYVDNFSVLLRQILNSSDEDFIPLEEEIEMLRNYLKMEKMRFDGHLKVEINPCKNTDVQIPSMIIQPFVENAIKHGLLHKRDGKKLIKIDFKLLDEETLICEVFDNGIGRKAAEALKSGNKRFAKSFSTNATQKRLELLQKVQFKGLGVEYTDLEDEQGKVLGTKVKITIPVE